VPVRVPKASERLSPPLIDVHVVDGQKDKSNRNLAEARAIVEEIAAMINIPRSVLFVTAVVMACVPAEARPLHVRSSVPAAGETIGEGRNTQYVLQFDGQIDHRTSTMEVISNGKVLEALVSLRGSEPSTLVASGPTLPPGRYQLHWRAKSVPDGDISEGFVSFMIEQ